ncbi:hypothetical protein [Streptacidiphilus fuscans]|uniref:Uncharacterized protein n=1 Tax=Streptacidiphilus fuscans TaxID=2789292 RepID=A0A931FCL1_9ACTN|nr:hypothetical protein [Streptacidiphilus fuscans]MBF9066576.1 hypothetical protein [Streptacidiphilus fuscans]
MNAWMRNRPWWQELLIGWVVITSGMVFLDIDQHTPEPVYGPPASGLVMAAMITGFRRWKWRYDRKEDFD